MTSKETCDKPLVSFILTCYNLPAELVRECLDSILCLSLPPYEREIIVVDDGSEHPIIEELTEYSNDIIYVRQKNQGLSMARNAGIRMANGRYIQFVDGDDKLLSKSYEKCLDIVRLNEPDMVLFLFSDKEDAGFAYIKPKITDGTTYMLNNNIHAAAWSYIFNRKILSDLRFTSGILHEDEEFTPLLILRAKTLYATNIIAYYYRSRPVSITHNTNKRMLVKRLNDMERTICHLHDVSLTLPQDESNALQRRVAQITMDYLYNIMRITRSSIQLKRRIERLKEKGLFPLPSQNYTAKYMAFRILINNGITRKLISSIVLK
ncbi:MAG: glycosyltransferase family 2 protein [Prevotella sp.]|nr:glycosyltransferase family 2 protein [Prevotella sp.]